MRILIYILISVFCFASCQSEQEKLLVQWEEQTNNCKIISVESVELVKPFLAADSITVLKHDYESLKEERLLQLKVELDTLQKMLVAKTIEFETLDNPNMKRYFKKGLERMEFRAERIKANSQIYQTHPEWTQLKVIRDKIEHYEKDSTALLGYLMEFHFAGKQGMLNEQLFVKRYLFQTNRKKILIELED